MCELTGHHNSSLQKAAKTCPNCGAGLHPAFYFCLTCATPYKPVEAITGRFGNFEAITESDLIKKKAPNVWPVFWSYVVVVFIGGLLSLLSVGDDSASGPLIVFTSLLMTAVTIFFACRFWTSLVVQFRKLGLFSRYAAAGGAILMGLLVFNYVYHVLLIELLLGGKSVDEPFSGLGAPALLIFGCVMPAIVEEIAFRGLIQHWLATAITPVRALLLASALFTALHLTVVSAPYIFAVGLLLGWVKMKTGSLYPSMLLHFVHNAVAIFVFPLIA